MRPSLSFSAKLDRLKECLGLREDQDVAAALGLSKAALSARKQRDAFPEDALLNLTATRPELAKDVVYVLTGDRSIQHRAQQLLDLADGGSAAAGAVFRGQRQVLVRASVELARELLVRRKRRSEDYSGLLDALDHLSDESLALVIRLVEKIGAGEAAEGSRSGA